MAGRKGFDTRRGRPPGNTKSDEVVALILDSIRQGVPIKHACSTFGVSEDCFHLWKNDGKTAKELHAKGEQLTKRQTWCLRFLGQLEAAKSDFVDQGVKLIRKAAKKDWKAASWLLTRRDPEHFAYKQ